MNMTTSDTLLQVWGLWRSGTNFMEYLIRNNIKNNNYERREIYNTFTGKPDALKHCPPDISKAQYHICVYKQVDAFMESHNRYDMKKTNTPRDVYWDWINRAIMFRDEHPDRVVLVQYEDFIGKELWHFREWQNKGWKIEFNNMWQVPLKRMGKGSGTNFE